MHDRQGLPASPLGFLPLRLSWWGRVLNWPWKPAVVGSEPMAFRPWFQAHYFVMSVQSSSHLWSLSSQHICIQTHDTHRWRHVHAEARAHHVSLHNMWPKPRNISSRVFKTGTFQPVSWRSTAKLEVYIFPANEAASADTSATTSGCALGH